MSLVTADGRLPAQSFQDRFGALRAQNTPAQRLFSLGIIYRYPPRVPAGERQNLLVPVELLPTLRTLSHSEAPASLIARSRPVGNGDLLCHLHLSSAPNPLTAESRQQRVDN